MLRYVSEETPNYVCTQQTCSAKPDAEINLEKSWREGK
jgi:hypothetical protein